jgi:hypothetical protein
MAEAIKKNSPRAMELSKRAVWGSLERGYRDALEHAWALLRSHWTHPDFREGQRAFAEKREPRWNVDPNAQPARDEHAERARRTGAQPASERSERAARRSRAKFIGSEGERSQQTDDPDESS